MGDAEHGLGPEGLPSTARRARARATLRHRAAADVVPLAAFGVFLVAGLVWLVHPWYPVEDLAVTELAVRQVGHHPPLSGAYSSLPFRHPGPLLFLYLWGPYELFGERSSALLAATIWANGAVLALVLALARRLGGTTLPVVLAGAVLLWAQAGDLPRLLQPWNPYVGALPGVALVLLAWAMVEQRRWALPVAVGMASWVVQAHIQFGPVAFVLLAVGLVGLVVGHVRRDGRQGLRDLRSTLAVATGVGVVLWSPVLADVALHGSASNPAAILRHYRGPQPSTVPRKDLAQVLRSSLSLQPTWAGGPRPYDLYLPGARLAPLALVPWLVAVLAARRRRAATELRGLAVGAVGLATALLALTGVTGRNLTSWYLISVEGTGLALDALVAASLVASLRWAVARRRTGRADGVAATTPGPCPSGRRAEVVAGVAVVALVVATTLSMHRRYDEEVTARATEEVLPAVERAVPSGRPVLVEARSGLGGWLQAALVLQLDRAGYDVFARTTLADKFPPALSAPAPDDAVRLVVITNPAPDVVWLPGVTVVADVRYALSPGERPLHVVIVSAPRHGTYVAEGS